MAHKLDFIKKEHILKAIQQLEKGTVPKNNQWSEYWIINEGKLYQFKYTVEVASTFTNFPVDTSYFSSNDSSRNYIAGLGFQIIFRSQEFKNNNTNYWVGASQYEKDGNLTDMLQDFIRNKYWRTDHDLGFGEGKKIYNLLLKVQINDRLCIRYYDKKGGRIHIAAMGTVSGNSNIDDGRLEIVWDYNPFKYSGVKPSGIGTGNWWKTLFQMKKHSDISLIFGETLIEKRVARLAWNDFGWVMPSGRFGKSVDKNSHEAKHGYGHEEWLFDTSKLINEFHYGFLEPIRKQQDAYLGKLYNVWLFSINGETKKRYWIGDISNLIVIDNEEAEFVKNKYIENGWFAEMEEQIRLSGANEKGFSSWKGVDLFNVKYKPTDVFVNDPYFELSVTHLINEQSRYSFSYFKDEYETETKPTDDKFQYSPPTSFDEDEDNPETTTHLRQPKFIEIVHLHRAISKSLTKTLRLTYGNDNVNREHTAGYGANKVDIVVKHGNDLIFFEIKTYNSAITSIREALGQLMEYCFYPDKCKAKALIVVTQIPANIQIKTYFKHLRDSFNIPLYYQSYDLDNKVLSERC